MNLEQISEWAGPMRANSFRIVAQLIREKGLLYISETGTFRGEPNDGQSTRIFAHIAESQKGFFTSIEINHDHLQKSILRAQELNYWQNVSFCLLDSVKALSEQTRIDVLYLDSFDHDPANPLPCQLHQLAELGAAYGKLTPNAIVLLDDCDYPTGGKAKLSTAYLLQRNWHLLYDGMQRVFIRGEHTY